MHTKLTPTNLKCRKKKSCGNLKALFVQCDTYYVLTQIQSELKKLFVYYRNIDYFVCLSPYSNSLEGKIAFTDDLIRIFSLCCQKIDFLTSHFAFVQFLFIYFSEKFNVLWYVNWTREAGKILKKFETDIIDKTKNDGYNGNEDLAEVQWNFAGALLYSVTVITTIGKKN